MKEKNPRKLCVIDDAGQILSKITMKKKIFFFFEKNHLNPFLYSYNDDLSQRKKLNRKKIAIFSSI